MKYDDHCQECLEKLGDPFPEVHRWQDEFTGTKEFGMKYRRVWHHEAGIKK